MNESPGQIVILNGAPRSGKSSIAAAIQASFEGPWMNLGVDVYARHVTPERYFPGLGLRPGGESPDLETLVPVFFAALYESVAAHSRLGLPVVMDIGHHDAYSRPLGILRDCASRLQGLPVLFVGVRCPVGIVMDRRRIDQPGRAGLYEAGSPEEPVPPPVALWQSEVHRPGIYDLELDTSVLTPAECAEAIRAALGHMHRPTAFERIAALL